MYALFLAQSDVNPWVRWILSADPLLLALIVLTISGLVVAFIKARATDRCLRAFRGYPVRVETGEASPITGTLRVGRDVIEVLFDRPRRLPGGERILSQLVYQSEFPNLNAVVRALDDLTPRQLRRRNRAKRRAERPSILRRGCRWLRNALNSIQDALQDTLGLLTGRLRGKAPGLAGADGGIRRAQKELTGAALQPLRAAAGASEGQARRRPADAPRGAAGDVDRNHAGVHPAVPGDIRRAIPPPGGGGREAAARRRGRARRNDRGPL